MVPSMKPPRRPAALLSGGLAAVALAAVSLAGVCALLLLACPAPSEARFIIVGNTSSPDNAWTQDWDYIFTPKGWQATVGNKLYVGDILVFLYPRYLHVVWDLKNKYNWDNCIYDTADFIGNDIAGAGKGFRFKVTSTPTYLACGVFGNCESGQKIIANGTLGPLPASPPPRRTPGQKPPPQRPPAPPPSPPRLSPPPPRPLRRSPSPSPLRQPSPTRNPAPIRPPPQKPPPVAKPLPPAKSPPPRPRGPRPPPVRSYPPFSVKSLTPPAKQATTPSFK